MKGCPGNQFQHSVDHFSGPVDQKLQPGQQKYIHTLVQTQVAPCHLIRSVLVTNFHPVRVVVVEISRHMYVCTYVRAYVHIHTDGQTDRPTDRRTDGPTDRLTYIHIYVHTYIHTQEDRGRLRAAGKIYFHLAADMVQKVGFTDAGIFLPTRG